MGVTKSTTIVKNKIQQHKYLIQFYFEKNTEYKSVNFFNEGNNSLTVRTLH